jgi:hypothetical protein
MTDIAMNEAQFLLSLGAKPMPHKPGLACPPTISRRYAVFDSDQGSGRGGYHEILGTRPKVEA